MQMTEKKMFIVDVQPKLNTNERREKKNCKYCN